MHTSTTITNTAPRALTITSRWHGFAAVCMGLVVLYFVGLSPFQKAHNTAHDTRHANGFPCH